jgi:F-type H+-transporting ATPase subunit a
MAIRKYLLLTILAVFSLTPLKAADEEGLSATDAILHHIQDAHDWHITDIPATDENGEKYFKPISLHLPWFFYSSEDGFVFASGTEDLINKGYVPHHEHLYKAKEGQKEALLAEYEKSHGHLALEDEEMAQYAHGVHVKGQEASHEEEGTFILDLSLTKTGLQMILIGLLMLWVFTSVAKSYRKREGQAPKGMQSLMETIIVFIREEVAKPYLGDKAMAFLPYLLTLFFFIWFANLFGLMPFNSNIAGNISVTAALAVLSFILIHVNSSKDYWVHIFNTPGVPWWLKFGIPLMPIVEVIGVFTKPFALAVRLFANISAGHFMVLGLVSLIFIMGKGGTGSAMGIMPVSVLFTLVIFVLEMIVAIIQPYVFTLLTAVFIGMAMESHDDHH